MNWEYIKHKRPVFKVILAIPGAKKALEWLAKEYLITDRLGRRFVGQDEIDFDRDRITKMDFSD